MASNAVTTLFLPLIFVLMDLELPCYSSLLLDVRLMYVVFSIWYNGIFKKSLSRKMEKEENYGEGK